MLNACWMHALHMWTRLISALMFISVPLFASQSSQKHTDQCVSNGVWREQVSQKNTSWTTCRSVCISTSAFMLYVVVARMRVSFWLKRACGLTGPVVNQILHRGAVAMKQAPKIWMKNVLPYGTMGRVVSPPNIQKIWTDAFNLRRLYMNCVRSLSSITPMRSSSSVLSRLFLASTHNLPHVMLEVFGSVALVQKLNMQPRSWHTFVRKLVYQIRQQYGFTRAWHTFNMHLTHI